MRTDGACRSRRSNRHCAEYRKRWTEPQLPEERQFCVRKKARAQEVKAFGVVSGSGYLLRLALVRSKPKCLASFSAVAKRMSPPCMNLVSIGWGIPDWRPMEARESSLFWTAARNWSAKVIGQNIPPERKRIYRHGY